MGYILGIQLGHDSSCCIIIDNQIIYAEEEERKNGRKNFAGLPLETIHYGLKTFQINAKDIDHVAIPWDYNKYLKSRNKISENAFYYGNDAYGIKKTERCTAFINDIEYLKKIFPCSEFHFIDHHISHLFSTLPFYDKIDLHATAGLVADALGEYASSTFYSDLDSLHVLHTQDINESIGYFYQRFSELVGFNGRQAPGYFMSLASLGDPYKFKAPLENYFLKRENSIKKLNSTNFNPLKGFKENAYLCFSKDFLSDIGFDVNNKKEVTEYKDLCASVQLFVENIVLSWCTFIKEYSNTENLLLSGGVFLNCKLNQKIKNSKLFKNIYLGPASKDSGTSLGAALYVNYTLTKSKKSLQQNLSAYLGTAITGKEKAFEIIPEEYLRTYENIAEQISRDLLHNKIIALAINRIEFGPRALGARSIICLPNNKELSKRINSNIKSRYPFQPFAGTMSEQSALDLFNCTTNEEFMTTTYEVNESHLIEGILHEDLTCRIHVVNSSKAPKLLNELFDELRKLDMPQIILNTSFNGNGKPLPSNAQDALQYYLEMDIDVLYTPVSRIEIPKNERKEILENMIKQPDNELSEVKN